MTDTQRARLFAAQIRVDLLRSGISLSEGRAAWEHAPDDYWDVLAGMMGVPGPDADTRRRAMDLIDGGE